MAGRRAAEAREEAEDDQRENVQSARNSVSMLGWFVLPWPGYQGSRLGHGKGCGPHLGPQAWREVRPNLVGAAAFIQFMHCQDWEISGRD